MSDSKEEEIASPEVGLTRRDLIRAVGLSAGGVALGLSTFGGGSTAQAAVAGRSFSAITVVLELDGTTTIVKSAAGGNAVVDVVLEPVVDGIQRKRPGGVRFEDLILELPFGMSPALLGWINSTLGKGPTAKNGALVYLDFNLQEVKRLEFVNAVITEVTLPALDGAGKDSVYVSIRLAPESARLAGPAAKPISVATDKSSSKPVFSSNYRLNVQGLEAASASISKVGVLTAKRTPQSGAVGEKIRERLFAPLDCSLLTITLAESGAGLFYAWFNDLIVNGKGGERAGRLEWLAPTLTTSIGFADLGNLGIVRYAPVAVVSGADSVARVEVDMYCETINLTVV
jgi:hypothetical protein